MNIIACKQNPIIKEIKTLKEKKYRKYKKLFSVEGLRFVEEALNGEAEIIRVIVSEQFVESLHSKKVLEIIQERGIDAFTIPDKLFMEISDTQNPQGILAVVKKAKYSIDDIMAKDGFVLILDAIQDPGNMGTIIRTADAAGAAGIIISSGCAELYNPKTLRSTMGSIFHVPLVTSNDLVKTITDIKSRGIKVYASHLDAGKNLFELDMKGNIAIIIGNEANGISKEVLSCADVLVKIPMIGRAESLNASIAAALLMYEAVRARQGCQIMQM